jgi:hypothetical protein
MVLFHEDGEISGSQVIDSQPDNHDHHSDGQNVDTEQFPYNAAFHGRIPVLASILLGKFVAQSSDGLNILGIGRIFFDFLADFPDMNINGPIHHQFAARIEPA